MIFNYRLVSLSLSIYIYIYIYILIPILIKQGCIKLIKTDSREIYNESTKDLF